MYVIEYHPEVLVDLKRVDNSVRRVLQKKLEKRIEQPRIPKDALNGELHGAYKVKDSKTGFRLIYVVLEEEKSIYVIAVNRRDRLVAYRDAENRVRDLFLGSTRDVNEQN